MKVMRSVCAYDSIVKAVVWAAGGLYCIKLGFLLFSLQASVM